MLARALARAAGDIALALVAEDDHRRLAGNPLGRAEDETVEDQVADKRHRGR